jgi:uncharacterized protein
MDSQTDTQCYTQWPPEQLDVRTFARDAAQLAGQAPLPTWERLSQEAQLEAQWGVQAPDVSWRAQGELKAQAGNPEVVWLHLQIHAALPLVCQRCLTGVLTPVNVDRSFRFVQDEATAMALDDEAQEDLLVLSREFNLRELVEDEVILAMPLVPVHEVCPAPLPMSAADPLFEQAQVERPNPFAALAGWKPGKSA